MKKHKVEKARFNFRIMIPALLLLAVGLAAYANSFSGGFIFDDKRNILENPNVRSLWPLAKAMSAPPLSGISGRPILCLSLALNYALSRYSTWSYHAFNVAIHLLAGLTLYAIVRRTLLSEKPRGKLAAHATMLAWITAAIWIVHPIQTQSVTYIIQRGESLMGLFYLLTLYAAIRATQSRRAAAWSVISILCCAVGMATKEVMVTAPVVVLLYDRTFAAGSFAAALRRRWPLYAGLAATWGILAAVMLTSAYTPGTAGFSVEINPLDYALNQSIVIVRYLRLSFWPVGLCLDYSWPVVKDWSRIVPAMLAVIVMLSATIWAMARNYGWSYLGVWFFGILAPTSSFVPLVDLIFEHRMYLPLAAVILLVVIAGHLCFRYAVERLQAITLMRCVSAALVIAIIGPFTMTTLRRNRYYRDPVLMWQSVLKVVPGNARAHFNLGTELESQNRFERAGRHYYEALQLKPDYPKAYVGLGNIFRLQGRLDEAAGQYQRALRLKPDEVEAISGLGNILQSQGRLDEAADYYRDAIRLRPDYAEPHNNLASVLLTQGKFDKALEYFYKALTLEPDSATTLLGIAWILALHPDAERRDTARAIELAQRAIALTEEQNAVDFDTLAIIYAAAGKFDQAQVAAQKAVDLARRAGNATLAEQIRKRLELYRQARPYPRSLLPADTVPP